jgi:hypothetical protein
MRDIDKIIHAVSNRLSEVRVTQNTKIHPADDDNLWWFRLPSVSKDVQIESADGHCPFWVETSSMASGADALVLKSVDEVIEAICSYLETEKQKSPSVSS